MRSTAVWLVLGGPIGVADLQPSITARPWNDQGSVVFFFWGRFAESGDTFGESQASEPGPGSGNFRKFHPQAVQSAFHSLFTMLDVGLLEEFFNLLKTMGRPYCCVCFLFVTIFALRALQHLCIVQKFEFLSFYVICYTG